MRTLIVCGLAREARAVGRGMTVVMSGGRPTALRQKLARLDPNDFDATISFGLAGGLNSTLAPGALLLPEGVIVTSPSSDAEHMSVGPIYPCSPDLITSSWETAAAQHDLPVASHGRIAGSENPILTEDDKRRLHAATGAVAVDMESHVAAAWAATHGLPFGILRVISDGAESAVPPAALAAMREDGGVDVFAVLGSLVRRPGQIPALVRTARDGAKAFRVLDRLAPTLSSRP